MRDVEVRRARARAQWLHAPGRSPQEVAGHLLAVQAQDLRAARRALCARGEGFAPEDVDAALAAGSLVVAWLNRGTLHLVRAEDHGWLLELTAREGPVLRRLAQLGVHDADARIERMLDGEEWTRAAFAARAGTQGQQTPALIALAGLRGRLVARGTHVYAPPPPRGPDGDLGARYLAAHAPAQAGDLARWAGIGPREARRALAGAEAPEPDVARVPPARHPAFDEYFLGWADRSFAVPARFAKLVHPGGGMIRACRTDDGLVVGPLEGTPGDADAALTTGD
jgi:hypothetical protein